MPDIPLDDTIVTGPLRYSDEQLDALGDNIVRHGQLQPIGVLKDSKRVVFGNHRVLAMRRKGLKSVSAVWVEAKNEKVVTLCENMHRQDLSPYLKWRDCQGILDANPGMTLTELAKEISVKLPHLSQIMAPGKCGPDVQQALKDGEITLAQVNEIAKSDDQAEALRLALGGATREKIAAARRKPEADAPKVDRIKLALPGRLVTVAGSGLTLEAIQSTLVEALDGVKKALKDGATAKTASRLFADKVGA